MSVRPGRDRHGRRRALGCGELRRRRCCAGARTRASPCSSARSKEERGGSTRYTGSWFRVTEDRQLDPKFVETMEAVSGGLADLDYCRTLERELPASLAFLEEHDVELHLLQAAAPEPQHGRRSRDAGRHGPGRSSTGSPACSSEPKASSSLYETEAVRLSVSAEGRVDGVVVRGRDGLLRTLHAGAVVIASGGFEGNQEMLTQYLGERACDLPVISPGTGNNRGEGIRMAVEVGADTAGQFDMFHAEPVDPRATKPDPVIYPYPYGIVVNGHAAALLRRGEGQLRLDLRGARLRDLAPPGADGVSDRRPDEPLGERVRAT